MSEKPGFRLKNGADPRGEQQEPEWNVKPQQSEIFAVFPLGKVLFSSINKLTCARCCRRM